MQHKLDRVLSLHACLGEQRALAAMLANQCEYMQISLSCCRQLCSGRERHASVSWPAMAEQDEAGCNVAEWKLKLHVVSWNVDLKAKPQEFIIEPILKIAKISLHLDNVVCKAHD